MRNMIWLIALLCCAAPAAMAAGPNAGGVLWVHDTGVAVTTDAITWPGDPADCTTSIDNTVDPDGVNRYWKVYAAFPAGSLPRLKTLGWATQYSSVAENADAYVNVTGGSRVNGETEATVFFLGGAGFPTVDGGTIGESFPPGARLTHVTPLFMFWGWGYNKDPDIYPCPTWSTAKKNLDDNFGDDAIPANLDLIAGYGSLGFGCAGTTPCPISTSGGCCNPTTGVCTMTLPLECSGVWQWKPCSPNPCPQPTGACCNTTVGYPACTIKTEANCTYTWLGAGTVCNVTTCPVPIPTGACCNTAVGMPDCTITTAAACTVLGFTYLGDNSLCDAETCPPVEGACCLPDGKCEDLTDADCTTAGGQWQGYPSACATTTCVQPEGACCLPDGKCEDLTDADCTTAGGRWQGYPSACATTTCEQPEGACCLPDGRCEDLTDADCTTAGGQWQGYPSACATTTCVQPEGACCLPDGKCEDLTDADCTSVNGQWRGFGTTCLTTTDCPQPEPTGACCNTETGYPDCQILTADACAAMEEEEPAKNLSPWVYLGDNVPCNVGTCPVPVPTGACCNTETGYPDCQILTADDCAAMGAPTKGLSPWVYLGDNVPCNVGTCPVPVPTGACCNMLLGYPACTITTAAECAVLGFTYLGDDVECNGETCPMPVVPTGACCNTLVGYPACTITTAAECAVLGFTYRGDDVPCDVQTCPVQLETGACCFRNAYCRIMLRARCAALRGDFVNLPVCVPSATPCYVRGGSSLGSPPPDDGAPAEQKDSWGQIKNRYR